MKLTKISICFLLALCGAGVQAQSVLRLDLKETIAMANDSSLSAFRYKNMYLSGYWEYRSYKAARLPSLTLNMTPAQYYRYITQRYDSQENVDVYREQQMLSASAGLSLAQNFDLLGGTFYVDTQLDYMRNLEIPNPLSSLPYRSVSVISRTYLDIMLSDGTGRLNLWNLRSQEGVSV